jgi:hypothetical protein
MLVLFRFEDEPLNRNLLLVVKVAGAAPTTEKLDNIKVADEISHEELLLNLYFYAEFAMTALS